MKNNSDVLKKLEEHGFNNNSIGEYPFVMENNKMRIKWNSKISGIYSWINKLNGKMYIGKGNNIYRRVYEEKNQFSNNKHGNLLKLYNAVKKYGIHNFEIRLLLEIEKTKLFDVEPMFIQFYDTKKNGYNITSGGEGCSGHEISENQIKKQKEKMKLYWDDVKKNEHSQKMKIWYNNKTENEKLKMKNSGKSWVLNEDILKKQRENCIKSLTDDRINRQKQSLLEYYKKNDSKKSVKCKVVNKFDNVFEINGLYKFCVDNHLSFKNFKKMVYGDISEYNGWKLINDCI